MLQPQMEVAAISVIYGIFGYHRPLILPLIDTQQVRAIDKPLFAVLNKFVRAIPLHAFLPINLPGFTFKHSPCCNCAT